MKKALLFLVGAMILLPVLAFSATYASPMIQTDKDYYSYGENIKIYYYNAPGYARDWVCIVPEGSPDTYAGDYQYIPQGSSQGVMVFRAPQPGNYEARAYYGYNPFQYFVTARYPFSVEGDEYGYSDDAYYEVPVVYGEPCYYAPPITVTFAFDYFTYEVYGSYVDIVFWRGGHRYRHHHWYDQGRRVTPNHIHSGQWHNRIRGSEVLHHRDRLKEHHKIDRPESYYGIKRRPEGKPDLRHQGQDYKRPHLQPDKGSQPQITKPQTDIKRMPQRVQPGQAQQWERKTGQQTPKGRVWGQQPSGQQEGGKPSSQTTRKPAWEQPSGQQDGVKPSHETTRKPAWGQPSQPSEQKSGSGRERSVEKEKKSRESSEPSERKRDSNRDESRDSDSRSQSSGGSSSQSDNRGWSGGSGGSSGGHSQGSPTGKNDEKRGRF